MAYNAPTARTLGELISASIYNTDLVDNIIALFAGAQGIASQAANDFIYASSGIQLGRLAAVAGKVPRFVSGAWAMAGLQLELLTASSSSTTTTSAENVATYAMGSGLTANDRLIVYYTWESVTQDAAAPKLYNVTDSLSLGLLSNDGGAGNIAAGVAVGGHFDLQLAQGSTTKVSANSHAFNNAGTSRGGGNFYTFTTGYTGPWTIAVRHEGMTSGGTGRWSQAIFVARGQ